MVSPLGQRQMFQTFNTEAVKAALDVGGQLQREAGLRQHLVDRMAEDQASVPEIPKADALRTEERQGRQGGDERKGSAQGEAESEAEDGSSHPDQAKTAEGHMDFLA